MRRAISVPLPRAGLTWVCLACLMAAHQPAGAQTIPASSLPVPAAAHDGRGASTGSVHPRGSETDYAPVPSDERPEVTTPVSTSSLTPGAGPTGAMQLLLEILRDRGSISNAEYDELRAALLSPGSPVAARVASPQPAVELAKPLPRDQVADGAAASDVDARLRQAEAELRSQQQALASLQDLTEGTSPKVVRTGLAGKWYERIGLRGYSQLRFSNVTSQHGAAVEVPADRSVNAAESFVLRRGRMIFSGDATDRLYVYAQSDFNGSTGAADFSLQMRDLYADIALDTRKTLRVRIGQSKVPFGFVNMQSSQNRAPVERPDALNSAVEGERDLGAYVMWASSAARQRFRELVSRGLKGSGDYGVVTVGAYGGQGLNRSDTNGNVHVLGRVAYPFQLSRGQIVELGVQGYRGRFVTPTQAITAGGATFTPTSAADGVRDERVAASFVWYPQPFGVEAEWNVGRGPQLSETLRAIETRPLHGGYVQVGYRQQGRGVSFPFARWHYFDGARKFARNAPRDRVNELDLGIEWSPWAELEMTASYTRTFRRTRTSTAPYDLSTDANRFSIQAQWNY